MYCVCKIKVNDAFILIYNLTPLNLSHNYDNKQYSQKHISDSFLLIIDLNHFFLKNLILKRWRKKKRVEKSKGYFEIFCIFSK